MEGDTKNRIIEESLRLFSIGGFEAVSIRSIADAVGIANSALYKHFSGKREIFDTIVAVSKERYLKQCNEACNTEIRRKEGVIDVCLEMFRYQTGDEWIMRFRKMLIIEQFKNPRAAELYREFFIEIPIQKQAAIFRELIAGGHLKKRDPEVLAMELYAPFFMFHTVGEEDAALTERFKRHAEYFFDNYAIKEKDGQKNDTSKQKSSEKNKGNKKGAKGGQKTKSNKEH